MKNCLFLLMVLWLPTHAQTMMTRVFPQDTVNHSNLRYGQCAPIERTAQNGYLLKYNAQQFGRVAYGPNPFVIKTDSNLNVQWAKQMDGINLVSLGDNTMLYFANNLETDTSSCGSVNYIDMEKIDATGHPQWTKRICEGTFDLHVGAALHSGTGVKLFGWYSYYGVLVRPLVLDIDMSGNLINADTLGLDPLDFDGIGQTYAGADIDGVRTYYTVSEYSEAITKMRADNSIVWHYLVGHAPSNIRFNCMAPLPNGDVLIGGDYVWGTDENDVPHMFLLKINDTGKVLWQKKMDMPGRVANMQLLRDGSVLLSAAGASPITKYMLPDQPVICIDTAANVLWARDMRPDTTYPIFNTLSAPYERADNSWLFTAITWNGFAAKVFTTDNMGRGICPSGATIATFIDTPLLTFTPYSYTVAAITVSITGQSNNDTLMLEEEYADSCIAPTVVHTLSKPHDEVAIYPNPAKGTFNIRGLTYPTHIELFDMTGHTVLTAECSPLAAIDIHTLAGGCYIVKMTGTDGMPAYKTLVVQR